MNTITNLAYMLTLCGVFVGGTKLLAGEALATTAIQQCYYMASACAWVILPYLLARSIEKLCTPQKKEGE